MPRCTNTKHHNLTTKFCPDCGEQIQPEVVRIDNPRQLRAIARTLGVRPDWHEPEEQKVTAKVFGRSFDNCGTWPYDPANPSSWATGDPDSEGLEMYVELYQEGLPVAQVNLATLFAMACETFE